MKKFELSAVLTGFYPESVRSTTELLDGIRQAGRSGFDAVEFYYRGTDEDTDKITEALDAYGLSSVFLASFPMKQNGIDLGDFDEQKRKLAVEEVKQLIDTARSFRSGNIMIVSGKEHESLKDRKKAQKLLYESLEALCTYIDLLPDYDPVLTMETFSNTGEPWFLMGPTSRFVSFAEKLRAAHKGFGATLDLSHLQQMGEDPVLSLRTAAGICPHIHIANCVISDPAHPLYGDKHPQFGHKEGAADEDIIRKFLKQYLQQSRNSGLRDIPPIIGLEVITRPPDQPAETMIYAKKYADAVLETL